MLIALGCVLITAGARQAAAGQQSAVVYFGHKIGAYQEATWHWERVMGARRTETAGRVLTEMSSGDLRKAALLWARRAEQARRLAQHPPHLRAWLCIHRYEGSWTDTGDPYWGGLQMSVTFQRHYGAWLFRHKGTADHWTPLEQIWTAERALRSRGFWPWPNTARFCGLL
ncbi:MAG TPA: hypothetical protein VKP14_05695 [Gaiellaceae bacterium]|nr:hypothetical protein [Gaiellaceae bacterium]